MTTSTDAPPSSRRSHPPLWLVEGLDVVEQRRSSLVAVTAGVVLLGIVLAFVAPGLVPPTLLVGAAVGLAAVLLGLAVAIALDAADLRLRGPRHVGAAGGELVAVLPTVADGRAAATLAAAVLEAREPGTPLLLGLAASSRDVRPTTAWTDALAVALEAEGVSVLRIDLASGTSPAPGLAEVVRDGVRLGNAVSFGPETRLARLGAGADHGGALEALSELPGRLPRDLDVLLVALPMAASRQVVAAVRSLDHVLIVAQRDRTSRVELIAGLDALESAGTRAQVALLDDLTAQRLAPPPTRVDQGDVPHESATEPAEEPVTELGTEPAPTDGTPPTPFAPADFEPEAPADFEPEAPADPDPEASSGPEPVALSGPEPAVPDLADDAALTESEPEAPVETDRSASTAAEPEVSPQPARSDLLDRLVGGAGVVPTAAPSDDRDGTDGTEAGADDAAADDPARDGTTALHAEALGGVGGAAIAAALATETLQGRGTDGGQPQDADDADVDVDVEDRASSDPRPLDVVDGAAQAAALARAATPDGPLTFPGTDSDSDTDTDPHPATDEEPGTPADSAPAIEPTDPTEPEPFAGSEPTEPEPFAASEPADPDSFAGSEPAVPESPGAAAQPEPDDADDADEQDATDRIPPVGGGPISRPDGEHDDLLRTTAQLSVLLDGLDGPPGHGQETP